MVLFSEESDKLRERRSPDGIEWNLFAMTPMTAINMDPVEDSVNDDMVLGKV